MRPAELHSRSAEENCSTENVASLRSVKVATPPCAAYAAIPCGLAVRKQHEMLFAASKFDINKSGLTEFLSEIHFLDEGKEEEKSTLEVLWNE